MTVTLPEAKDGSEFVAYGDFAVEYRDASHRYWLHHEGQRTPAVSVTGVLKILDKPALIPWAEAAGAIGAARLAEMGELQGVPMEDVPSLVRLHGLGADAKRDEGAGRGTLVHDALSAYMTTGSPPSLRNFDPRLHGYVQGLSRWLVKASPTPTMVEAIVGSVTHSYAGRLDLRADIGGVDTLLDVKTNPKGRAYLEAHAQLQGYAVACEECGYPAPERMVVIAVGEDGSFSETECQATPEDWLSILACQRSVTRVRNALSKHDRAVLKAAA
jgi:hypothetical protein